jgi:hypothetical protein
MSVWHSSSSCQIKTGPRENKRHLLNQAIVDYFRCPEGSLSFRLSGEPSGSLGYFRFGQESICYGHCSSGFVSNHPTDALYDAADHVVLQDSTVGLSFDLNAVVSNLRTERYVMQRSNGYSAGFSTRFVRDLYYFVRPCMPLALRKRIQRVGLRGWSKLQFPRWPLDCSVDGILQKALLFSMKAQRINRMPFIWFWPEGALACACVTHDVETSTGRDFCSSLMELDREYQVKASFQIVPEKRYDVSDSFLDRIRQCGNEVNIQDLNHDGQLFRERKEFLRRAELIGQYVKRYRVSGFRSAIMYRNPEWLESLQIAYDMSIPNVAHLDAQRGGCCTVMPYFIGRILEIPLTTTQDYSLFHILGDYSIDVWKRQLDLILKWRGIATFIVHPDYVVEQRARETYRQLLEYLSKIRREQGIWLALPGEVNRWWRDRSQMTLVNRGKNWAVEGPGKERARVAYAITEGEHLKYEFA